MLINDKAINFHWIFIIIKYLLWFNFSIILIFFNRISNFVEINTNKLIAITVLLAIDSYIER